MTLNDEIIAYLTLNNIAWSVGDYETGQPAGEADQILYWSQSLGAQPSQAQLDAAYQTYSQTQSDKALYDSIVVQTQQRLDDFAKTRGYDGILSAVTYATSTTTKFQIEGQYCLDQRDATWDSLITMFAEVQAGTRPKPTSYADIEPDLPPLVWPNP